MTLKELQIGKSAIVEPWAVQAHCGSIFWIWV